LFEAAACEVPIISDIWDGLDTLFEPDHEIVLAEDGGSVLSVLIAPAALPRRIGRAARQKILGAHTARHRALELESLLRQPSRALFQSPVAEVEHA